MEEGRTLRKWLEAHAPNGAVFTAAVLASFRAAQYPEDEYIPTLASMGQFELEGFLSAVRAHFTADGRQVDTSHVRSIAERLSAVPIFASVTDTEFFKLLSLELEPRRVPLGSLVIRRGDVGQEMYFLTSGEVEVLISLDQPAVTTLREGASFGESALMSEEPRNAYIRASRGAAAAGAAAAGDGDGDGDGEGEGYVDLYVLSKAGLQRTLASFPEIEDALEEEAWQRRSQLEATTQGSSSDQPGASLMERAEAAVAGGVGEGSADEQMFTLQKGPSGFGLQIDREGRVQSFGTADASAAPGPAETAGVKLGMRICAVNGYPCQRKSDVIAVLSNPSKCPAGDVTFAFLQPTSAPAFASSSAASAMDAIDAHVELSTPHDAHGSADGVRDQDPGSLVAESASRYSQLQRDSRETAVEMQSTTERLTIEHAQAIAQMQLDLDMSQDLLRDAKTKCALELLEMETKCQRTIGQMSEDHAGAVGRLETALVAEKAHADTIAVELQDLSEATNMPGASDDQDRQLELHAELDIVRQELAKSVAEASKLSDENAALLDKTSLQAVELEKLSLAPAAVTATEAAVADTGVAQAQIAELQAAKLAAEEALDIEIANATELEAAKAAAEEAQAVAEEALHLEIAAKAELELEFVPAEVPSDDKDADKEVLKTKVANIEADNAKLRAENADLHATLATPMDVLDSEGSTPDESMLALEQSLEQEAAGKAELQMQLDATRAELQSAQAAVMAASGLEQSLEQEAAGKAELQMQLDATRAELQSAQAAVMAAAPPQTQLLQSELSESMQIASVLPTTLTKSEMLQTLQASKKAEAVEGHAGATHAELEALAAASDVEACASHARVSQPMDARSQDSLPPSGTEALALPPEGAVTSATRTVALGAQPSTPSAVPRASVTEAQLMPGLEFAARVTHAETPGVGHTTYLVELYKGGVLLASVVRRYSEFDLLRKELCAGDGKTSAVSLLHFPPKMPLRGKKSSRVVQRREADLQAWMNAVLRISKRQSARGKLLAWFQIEQGNGGARGTV